MSTPEQNVISEYYENYKETQAYIFKTAARKSRNMIFVVAIVLFIGNILGLAAANVVTVQTFLSSLAFPVIFLAIGFVAPKQPMGTMIISIAVFIIIILVSLLTVGFASLISGLIVKAIIVFCLIAGFTSAREAERAKTESQ